MKAEVQKLIKLVIIKPVEILKKYIKMHFKIFQNNLKVNQNIYLLNKKNNKYF